MKPTYVLFVPGKASPTICHATLESAREEARRLSTECFCEKVMICQFVEGVERVTQVKVLKRNPLAICDAAQLAVQF